MGGTGQMVSIFGYGAKSFEQEEEICKKSLEACVEDKERWEILISKLFNKPFYSSFGVFEHGYYFAHKCDGCGCEYNLPELRKKCIKCGSEKIKARQRHVGKCGVSKYQPLNNEVVNPELYKSAVEDLQNNPVPHSTVEPNWDYLQQEVGGSYE